MATTVAVFWRSHEWRASIALRFNLEGTRWPGIAGMDMSLQRRPVDANLLMNHFFNGEIDDRRLVLESHRGQLPLGEDRSLLMGEQ